MTTTNGKSGRLSTILAGPWIFDSVQIVVAALAEAVQEKQQRPFLAIRFVVLRHEQLVTDGHFLRDIFSPPCTVTDCGNCLPGSMCISPVWAMSCVPQKMAVAVNVA